jgi:NAD(P)-dependent dehydrogenase (short-subunit alcohol dehydrogenase family)
VTATETWQVAGIPDQKGRTIVVTGPTVGGLGYYTALELARKGARVVLAGRTPAKVDETVAAIEEQVPGAELETLQLDLASLDSVRHAGAAAARLGPIDVLVNNAGVMGTSYSRTDDGLELQMATNHFGPFLLTGLLLPQLVASGDGRVVTVSSLMHTTAPKAPLGDPRNQEGRYFRWPVYGQTKLANLLFTLELQRRLQADGSQLRAHAAHPGYAATNLQSGMGNHWADRVGAISNKIFAQSEQMGALPTLFAATQDLPGASYVGPDGFMEQRGHPTLVGRSAAATDVAMAKDLWLASERLTGVSYPSGLRATS